MCVAPDLDLAGEDIYGALLVRGVERQHRAGSQMHVGEHRQ
jgi:hypothetical protein